MKSGGGPLAWERRWKDVFPHLSSLLQWYTSPESKPRPSKNTFLWASVVVSEQVPAVQDSHLPGAGGLGVGEIAWKEEPRPNSPSNTVCNLHTSSVLPWFPMGKVGLKDLPHIVAKRMVLGTFVTRTFQTCTEMEETVE